MIMMDNYDADKERENLNAAMTPDPLTPSPDSPTPDAKLNKLTQEFVNLHHSSGHAESSFRVLVADLISENAALVKEREELRTELQASDEQQTRLAASISDLRATLAEREAKESSLIKELHARIEERNATISRQADTLAERDREIGRLYTKLKVDVTQQLNEKATLRAQLAETQQHVVSLESQLHSLGTHLSETQEKLKEAEHDLKRTRESDANHEALWKQGAAERVALEAHIEKLREALESCRVVQLDDVSATYHFDPTLVSDALCSRPELPQSAQ